MKVAITAAAGYVGNLLLQAHHQRGDNVHALARNAAAVPRLSEVRVHECDITQPDALEDDFFNDTDVLYHCAAEILRPELMQNVNVEATRALLARARGRVRHWVQLSSLSVYGTPRHGTVNESSPLRPRSLYARTKIDSDAVVAEAAQDAFSYTIVRPAAVIGPHMKNGSMRALIEAVVRGRFCFVGPAGALANYIHEDNVIEALMLCATRPEAAGRTYNLSQNVPIDHMIDVISQATHRASPRLRLPEVLARAAASLAAVTPRFPLTRSRVDALTSRVEYPSTRIEQELGYRHLRSLDDALTALVRLRAGAR